MKRTELLAQVRSSHARLEAALEGLTDEEAARVGVTPQWSVKDALAHITAWEIEGADAIRRVQQGTFERKALTQEAIDRFNAEAAESRRDLAMSEVRREFDEVHASFVNLLESLPEEVDERSPIYKFTEGVAIHHHAHHAAQIEEWKKGLSDK